MYINQLKSLLLAILLIPAIAVADSPDKQNKTQAQMQRISEKIVGGTIIDENEEPLIGAMVKIAGTDQGVITDSEGQFSILVAKSHSILIVSYVGYKPVEMELPDNVGYISIKMEPAATMMNDVIVTGYQNIKRESSTGAYQLINSEELEKRHTTDIVSNLEGNIPGLVRSRGQYKSGEEELLIRGTGTFEARTAPLVVVDGLPIEGGLGSVNQYDIESITVLKDASAAAIYGARASNGVIVITTKLAKKERLTIDFNADLTITEKQKYDNFGWASAAEYIELEQYNWNAMLNDPDQSYFNSLMSSYNLNRIESISPVTRLFIQNYNGELSDAALKSTLDQWSRNDYRKEYSDAVDRTQVTQQYNLALRTQGKVLTSSIVANYMSDNTGKVKDNSSSLSFKYRGDLKVAPWFDLAFSVNVLNNRSKSTLYSKWGDRYSYHPYMSMYNADGTLNRMEADVRLNNEALSNPDYGLLDHSYNLNDEIGQNRNSYRYTNVRSYVQAVFKPLPGWTIHGMFQYEDITSKYERHYTADSYYMRHLYNLYTTSEKQLVWVDDPFWDFDSWDGDFEHIYKKQIEQETVVHHVPAGGALLTSTSDGAYYTFRAQTAYRRDFGPHAIDVMGGFEYRQTHMKSHYDTMLGYNHQTQTNNNVAADWAFFNGWGKTGVLGTDYTVYGVPYNFETSDVLHRYYSLYATANYVYDRRYSVSGSYRVDKCDLFGTAPKFRGRPLWSVGASWNMHNEDFMQPHTWIDALKIRASYGLTGNIDSSVSSYLTATIDVNSLNNANTSTLQTPPNDQLRWEKTATWNVGLDFSFLGYRLNGSIDFYRKSGSDLLTMTDLDCTTGWTSLTINSGNMINKGVELMLDAHIIQPRNYGDLGVNLSFNYAHNSNKVTKISHLPGSGSEYLSYALHLGYPIHSMFSVNYGGLLEEDGMYYGTWIGHDGERHTTSTGSGEFKIEDCIYSGSLDPKWSGGFTPEITWKGFTLSGMFNFYGGHMMRVNGEKWDYMYSSASGYSTGTGGLNTPSCALDYWRGKEGALPNGYKSQNVKNASLGAIDAATVEHADYLKLRNLVLGYDFSPSLCRKIGLSDLRLRVQMNNVFTWVRNSAGADPEATSISTGDAQLKAPRSYTMSLYFNI